MNLFTTINDVQCENVFFLETKKNVIINGNFTKIAYYDSIVSMNGLYIQFPICVEKSTNRYQIIFNPNHPTNAMLIQKILAIESNILHYFRSTYAIPYYKKMFSLLGNLNLGKIKLYKDYQLQMENRSDYKTTIILKISGIWENENEFGITCKFLEGIIQSQHE